MVQGNCLHHGGYLLNFTLEGYKLVIGIGELKDLNGQGNNIGQVTLPSWINNGVEGLVTQGFKILE